MVKCFVSLLLTSCVLLSSFSQEQEWAVLANEGFENQSIKSVFFFAGNWRNGVQFYDYNPSDNTGLYTVHPQEARHLGWSESVTNRDFALERMMNAGVNVINMSYWGLPGTDNWAHWAPMQSSSDAHDELFNAAMGNKILVAPYIESFAATNNFDGFRFADDFPGSLSDPAPRLITFLLDLVDRYLIHPEHPDWPQQWARLIDQNGMERYLVSIIHVASNTEGMDDQSFAEAFDRVAEVVFETSGVHLGFALDILPPDNYAPGLFKATPLATGPWLRQQSSILAIQCFIPEIWTGDSDENDLSTWKENYLSSWIKTGIPVIHDISPGYDAHIVFPSSPIYGNNQIWRDLQSQQIDKFGSRALTFNAWNGFPEGFAGMPTLQYGDSSYTWLCELMGGQCWNTSSNLNKIQQEQFICLSPNPVANSLTFRLNSAGEEILLYKIYNSNGDVVLARWNERDPSSSMEITVQMPEGQAGIFILVVHTIQGIHSIKFLRVK